MALSFVGVSDNNVFPFLQDGIMVPFTQEIGDELKHSLKRTGKKFVFSIKGLGAEDAGVYSVDVGGVNIFSTEFKGKSPQV